ncbi:unnamed protein product [Lampetra planeri]
MGSGTLWVVTRPRVKFQWLFEEDTNGSAAPAPVRLDSRRFVSQTTGNLYFSHVKQRDVGRYSCLLHRQMGPVLNKTVNSSFISLQLKKDSVGSRLAVRLEVRPPPTMDVLVGQKLRLECFGMGNPVPNITWHRPGALLLKAGPVLEIEEVQTSDNGTYRCNANNKLGNTSASTEVLVHARPQWTLGIVNANIHIGNDLYWSCNATGTPTPLYQWLRNGILLESKGRILVSRDDGRLKITSVNMSDEGMYQCVASNEHGEIYSSAQLRVLAFAPEFNHSHPTVVQAVRGGSVNIACALHAAPRPSISWGRGTESLPNSSKMTILENGSLAIRDLERSDHGSYTCFAMNSLGKANATVTLQVKGKMLALPHRRAQHSAFPAGCRDTFVARTRRWLRCTWPLIQPAAEALREYSAGMRCGLWTGTRQGWLTARTTRYHHSRHVSHCGNVS